MRFLTPASALLLAVFAACGPRAVDMRCTPFASPEELAERPSPYDSVEVAVDSARAKLCYSRPSTRGRVVFGELVPWDVLWRTGANEATIIHLSRDAEVAGLDVRRGSYSVYTVPGEDEWQLVLNASTGQWGQTRDVTLPNGQVSANSYTPEVQADEVGRVPVETQAIDFVEQLTAELSVAGDREVRLTLDWETTRIVVPIRFVERD